MKVGVVISIVLGFVSAGFSEKIFNGENGLLIMEVESTASSKGDWKEMKSVDGFTGDCHFEFTGNKPASGPANDPLEYRFTVDKDGIYNLLIRAHKRLDGEEPDKCNDCYVRLAGDFDSAGPTSLDILRSDKKLYGGSQNGWGWTAKLDVGHKKWPAVYRLKAGEEYTLVVSGRSQRFNMDRIVFKHQSVADKKAKDPKQPESRSK